MNNVRTVVRIVNSAAFDIFIHFLITLSCYFTELAYHLANPDQIFRTISLK